MHRILLLLTVCVGAFAIPILAMHEQQDRTDMRTRAAKLFSDGNNAEALVIYRGLSLDPKNTDKDLPNDVSQAVMCQVVLRQASEIDDFLEEVVTTHSENWRVLFQSASLLRGALTDPSGFLIAGKFERGPHRGGGQRADSTDRDRVRALQLLLNALPLLEADQTATPRERSDVFHLLANSVGAARYDEAWQLQIRTDLSTLPEVSIQNDRGFGWRGGFGRQSKGAPVTETGTPVFHHLPTSWDTAKSDGERWRWALEQVVLADATRKSEIDLDWADFLRGQFGVRADVVGPSPVIRAEGDDPLPDSDIRDAHLLPDTETIAKLTTGVKRFPLPDEFNHIVVIKRVIARNDGDRQRGLRNIADVRMNRHQYPRAADVHRELLKLAENDEIRRRIQSAIDQIEDNWLQFQSTAVQPALTGATLDIRYRNGNHIAFTARPIRIDRLLSDVKQYISSRPKQPDYQKLQIDDVGYRLVHGDQDRYLEDTVAEWQVDLTPAELHFDSATTITTPLQNAGAYWVTAKMRDGNEARIVMWVADTAITRKRVEDGTMYYVADAVSGAPVAGAALEFFGWRRRRIGRTRNYQVLTRRFAERTDADGLFTPENRRTDVEYQWLMIATTEDGRLAYDGFSRIWAAQEIDKLSYSPVKVYSITDRPVYRPSHTVKFRMWVRQPRFDSEQAKFADQEFLVEVRNPKGDIVQETTITADRWGGIDGEYTLPVDAALGAYQLRVCDPSPAQAKNHSVFGTGSFRVEEYRKPEFEVTIDSPEKPVKLGEGFKATVNATYYFGAPVTEGTIHYKVERSAKDNRWYPVAQWDWLYGPGYWWFAPEYAWYPRWQRWGCFAPIPPWRGWQPDPPEVVAEGDAPLRADGTFEIDVDTATALTEHGDSDHSYSITAEVVDQSRRTITGSGSVIVARDPFRVFVWTDRGHYRTGDTVTVGMQARTPDGHGVEATGKLILYSVTYDGDTPVETPVETWELATDASGSVTQKLVVPNAGQFRIAAELTDDQQHTQQGGYVLFVRGQDNDGRGYRFNDLELITDKREYAPGDKVVIQVNTDKINSTVLLFVRPVNGLCPQPIVLRLDGKSATYELVIDRSDMPNIFLEALTIADGKIHTAVREIVVPPEKRVANVEVLPSHERYRPGDEATVRLKLTDVDGKPFAGNTVLSVYDASLEYIAASTIPEIRSFFWNVRRHHHAASQSTLQRTTSPTRKGSELGMRQLLAPDRSMIEYSFGGGLFPTAAGFSSSGIQRGMRGSPFAVDAAEGVVMDFAAPSLMAKTASAGAAGAVEAEPQMRSNFADTAYWIASVDSDAAGVVEVKFTVPDNLTTWKIKAWTLGDGTRVGSGSSDVVCSKDLIIRPQTPRFFTETDRITVSAVVHNYLDSNKSTRVVLESEGGQLQLPANATQTIQIPAGGEVRVDWNVQVVASGQTTIRMMALTDEESDATEFSIPVQVHGILKTDSFTGVIRPDDDSAVISINVPAPRIEEQSRLEIHYSPSLAGAMVDALPYLIDYPYGCTEQTLNRFLPAVLTQRTLQKMGINLAEVQEKRTNLNAQELGDPDTRAAQWKRYDRNPVFNEAEMNRIVKDGVRALTDMQLADGGWGWFSGDRERSSAHVTAQIVHGLTVAQNNDVAVLPDVLNRGVEWLKTYQARGLRHLREGDWRREHPKRLKKRKKDFKDKADNMDAYVAWVLSEHDAADPAMADYLYRDRANLSVYSKALTGLVLHAMQRSEQRNMLLRNIEQFLVQDDENQTAWLKMDGGIWWYWYGSENEAMASYLRLLLKVRPDDPIASRLVKYLLNNRKHGTWWNSTRDTAMVVEAMADFITTTGEDRPDMTVEILIDGQLQKRVRITSDNFFSFDNVVLLQGDAVKTGQHRIEIRRSGTGPVYFNAYLTNFTKADLITAAGLEVKVQRKFYRLERDDQGVDVQGDRGQVVQQQTARYRRIPIENLGSVTSGELVEIELIIDSKNDYEYLLLEDHKPSGFEPDDQRSGYVFEGLRAYRELRDDRVSFFLARLARGQHSISYRMRAESPSEQVSALPAQIQGMYAPELVGNSNEIKLSVTDR
jgi:alpha-2-macroglobulin